MGGTKVRGGRLGKMVFLNLLSTSEVESGAYTRKEDAKPNPG